MDGIDTDILTLIQDDGRISNAEIARRVGMAPSATLDRIRKLEANGVITGYQAMIDPQALGLTVTAFIFVVADESSSDWTVADHLAAIPDVQEVHYIAGEDCYLTKVRAADTEALGHLVRDQIGAIEGVTSTRTSIVMTTIKETSVLPLNGQSEEDDSG
jgi:Lrp/AsnC family transcriptional regulator, leucine-responsive regulatory protein